MCVIDYDPPEFISETWRASRKGFACDDCHRHFVVGTRRLHVAGKWDGRLATYQRCADCVELAEQVEKADCSWAFGSLLEDAEQTIAPFGDHVDANADALGRVIGILFRIRENAPATRVA